MAISYQASGILALPDPVKLSANDAIIPSEKLGRYILSLAHPDGRTTSCLPGRHEVAAGVFDAGGPSKRPLR
jgi:hypothetical protein